jgi:paraquat-inducible protein B
LGSTSLSGLKVGAAVEFRGVPIGSVRAIRLNIGNMPPLVTSSSQAARIPVIVELHETKIILRGRNVNLANPKMLSEAIARGLRGQLRLESFVTGISYVALDIVPGTPAVLCLPTGSGYREIPTVPTTLEQAQDTLHRLIARIDEANVEDTITSVNLAMKGINGLVSSPGLHAAVNSMGRTEHNLDVASQNFSRAAVSLRILSDTLDSRLPSLITALETTSTRADRMMAAGDKTATTLRAVTEPGSPVIYRVNGTLDNIWDAAHSIQQLADYLQLNPSAILRGRE